jgi:hypothetical protein
MKLIVTLTWLCFFFTNIFAQKHNIQTRNQICVDIGNNLHNKPQSSIFFKTSIHRNLIYSIQIKSSNSYYLLSSEFTIFRPQVEFYYHPKFSKLTFLFGIGNSIEINSKRLNPTTSKNSFEPFLSSTLIGSIHCFRYQLPIQLFASFDHSGIRALPEIAYRTSDRFSIYLRSEFIFDNQSMLLPNSMYQQAHVGFQYLF